MGQKKKKLPASAIMKQKFRSLSKEERKELLSEQPKCKKCGKELISKEIYDKFIEECTGAKMKSYNYSLLPKEVNGKYYFRKYCEDCIIEKFGELKKFNTFNEQVIWALEIPEEEAEKDKKKYDSASVESWISKYGEVEGKKKYIEYCNRQAFTNSFEYKKEKYGWTEEDFNEYNKSRAVTMENLIKRHGEEKAKEIWRGYIAKQSDMFGKLKGKDFYVKLNKFFWNLGVFFHTFADNNSEYVEKVMNPKEFKLLSSRSNFEFFLIDEFEGKIVRNFYDISIPELKLLFEVDTEYHRGNSAKVRIKDNFKTLIAIKHGYTLVRVNTKKEYFNEAHKDNLLGFLEKELNEIIDDRINEYHKIDDDIEAKMDRLSELAEVMIVDYNFGKNEVLKGKTNGEYEKYEEPLWEED